MKKNGNKNTVINADGELIDFESAVNQMDDDVRESVHSKLAPCTDQEFFDEYCKQHLEKFHEYFEPAIINGQW